MKISILGAGRWGTLLAWVYNQAGHEVVLWNRPGETYDKLIATRSNKYLSLPESILITADLPKALEAKLIFMCIKAQNFNDLCQTILKFNPKRKLFILAMKGLEETTGRRLSEIFFEDYFSTNNNLGILAGPGHAQEISKGIPTVMALACKKRLHLKRAAGWCQTDLVKIKPVKDFIGVEIGAALKNIIGLAAGILTGLDMASLKSALLVAAPFEVGQLIKALGGKAETAYGLAHLGDYGATVFSGFSHNHQAGELWVKEKKFSDNAEGLPTLKAVKILMDKYKVAMPVCEAVYNIFYNNYPPKHLVEVITK